MEKCLHAGDSGTRQRCTGRMVPLLLALAIVLSALAVLAVPSVASAEDDPTAIDGVFYKCSDSLSDSKNIPMAYHWSDTYFSGTSSEYSLPLADMSLCMEMALGPRAMSWDDNQYTD